MEEQNMYRQRESTMRPVVYKTVKVIESTPDDGLRGERFKFETSYCDCRMNTLSDDEGKIYYTLKIRSDSNRKLFYVYNAFLPLERKEHDQNDDPQNKNEVGSKNRKAISLKIGLMKFNKKTQQVMDGTTPLEALISLGEWNQKYAERLKQFIERYGFFWPISEKIYTEFDVHELFLFLKPLCKLHELLEELTKAGEDDETVDYDRLFKLTFFYIFTCRPTFKFQDNDFLNRIIMPRHYSFGDAWWSPNQINLYNNFHEMTVDEFSEEFFSYNQPIPPKYAEVDPSGSMYNSNINVPKGNIIYIENDPNNNYFSFYDTFFETEARLNQVNWMVYLTNKSPKEFPLEPDINQCDHLEIRREIEILYFSLPREDTEARVIIDFLFHLSHDVTDINRISKEGDIECESSLMENDDFTLHYKKALIKIAKMICKKEIDWGIRSIRPVYNIEKMCPNWDIPDLLSALYFSHFYIDPKQMVFRKCENIKCDRYFEIQRTNSKQRYCEKACRDQVSQRNYRKKSSIGNSDEKDGKKTE